MIYTDIFSACPLFCCQCDISSMKSPLRCLLAAPVHTAQTITCVHYRDTEENVRPFTMTIRGCIFSECVTSKQFVFVYILILSFCCHKVLLQGWKILFYSIRLTWRCAQLGTIGGKIHVTAVFSPQQTFDFFAGLINYVDGMKPMGTGPQQQGEKK